MRNKFSLIFVSILGIFVHGMIYADTHVNSNPPETIVMTISNDDNLHWKEISRVITDEECLVERIPHDQDEKNWSELITIQYFSKAVINKEIRDSIERVVNQLKNVTLARYPKDTVVWRVIEKNKDDVLFEWILTKPYKNSRPQHEICRAFLTPTSFHRIGVTKKYKEMNQEERNQWIKALRESTEIISFEAALHFPQGLSLAETNPGRAKYWQNQSVNQKK